jgi:hypothetical protein
MKLKRRMFTAIFFLACIAVLELEKVVLEEIWGRCGAMKIKAWGPLFALLALLGAGLTGLSLQHPNAHNQTELAKSGKGNGPVAETIIQATLEKGDKKGKDEKSWTDPLLVLFNGLLTLFTWLLYRATQGLFKETAGLRSAADKQSRDMEASIRAAQKSAEAAQKAADVSEAALIVAERPYLVPVEPKLKIFRYGPPGSIPSEPPEWVGLVEYSFKNVGRSVAFLKEVTAELAFYEELPDRPRFSVPGVRILLGHYPIGVDRPYASPNYGTREKKGAAKYASVRDDKLQRFFFGFVRYSDIFGYLHTDGFCFRFTKIGDGAGMESECTIVGGNTYNFSRREKIPASGYENPTLKQTEVDLTRINKIADG